MPTEADTVAAVLAAAVARHFGGPASIEKLARELGGASRQTWSFDAVVKGQRHGLILRRDPPILGEAPPGQALGKAGNERSTALDRATEFRVLAAAHKAGVRAPEPLFELKASDGLGEAYVMRRIGGTAIARKLLRDPPYAKARGLIAGQLGEILARIHATPLATLPPLAHREAADHIAACATSSICWASRSPCSSWRCPGSTGASPRRPRRRCWSMATTAPATTWPTKRA